ncbi:MAG: DUF4347 domain-containing protein [Cyanobacteria bacterium P01_B01_bin.77]
MMNLNASEQSEALSIAFVDKSLAQTDVLLTGFQSDHVVMLNDQSDGIDQISQVLEQYDHNLDSIHIFSQGSNGAVQLGNVTLEQSSLRTHRKDITGWSDALTKDGDLLLYGSNIAADKAGQNLIKQMSQLTQADIAASSDFTGNKALGGDWKLEFSTGKIKETYAANSYQSLLSSNKSNGLRADYYDNIDFTNLKFTRTDTAIDFDWRRGTPNKDIKADTFSVRWSGQIEAEYSETYKFRTTTDDGVRLWVNDELIVDKFKNQAATSHTGTIALEAGQKYDIKMDYYENRGKAVAELYWSSPSQELEIVPESHLFNEVAEIPSLEADQHRFSNDTLLDVQFESQRLGKYTKTSVAKDWENVNWSNLYDRAHIVEDPDGERGQVLEIKYPKGAVGPKEGGGQFEVSLPEAEELWLSYYVKFGENFDFRRGGKLPGLASGGGKFTGGNSPDNGDGWTARYMWRDQGRAVAYAYYVDKPGKWGEDIDLDDFAFSKGDWHQITQHIKLNTDNKANGLLETWVDGEKHQSRSDMRWRLGDQGLIDSIYFSTFHGGGSDSWAPQVDSKAFFDGFVVSEEAPTALKLK